MENHPPQHIKLLGTRIDDVTYAEAIEHARTFLHSGRQHHIVTVNPEFLMEARENPLFRNVLNNASLAVPDGIGLLFASRLRGTPLRQRVTGADLTAQIAALAEREGARLFLLGAGQGVAHEAAKALKRVLPKLHIVGAENEFSFLGRRRSDAQTVERIRRRAPDILLVAFGAPKQDLWIADHLANLPSVKLAMGVGGTLDFLSGRATRAPHWMRSIGLEWAWRLLREPSRLGRIMTATVRFPLAILREKS